MTFLSGFCGEPPEILACVFDIHNGAASRYHARIQREDLRTLKVETCG